jgi:hypothetical protein
MKKNIVFLLLILATGQYILTQNESQQPSCSAKGSEQGTPGDDDCITDCLNTDCEAKSAIKLSSEDAQQDIKDARNRCESHCKS